MSTKMTPEDFKALESATSAEEWNRACSKIKETYDGFPDDDWYVKVVLSGFADRVAAKWGGDAKITITGHR